MCLKVCSKCKLEKELDKFNKSTASKDGLTPYCKECVKVLNKERYERIKKPRVKRVGIDPVKLKARKKKYYNKTADVRKAKAKEYYQANKLKCNAATNTWHQLNKAYINDYKKLKLKNDIQFRLATNLRSSFKQALKNGFKGGSAVRDLGCSIEEFKDYIESLFVEGMTWDNYGEWQLDHIFPLSKLDLTDRLQLRFGLHWTNYQPLWKLDNIKKGCKI